MKTIYEFQQAPIFLARSFYPIVVFEANPEFGKRDSEIPPALSVNIGDIRFEPNEEDENQVVTYMTIRLEWPDEPSPPYNQATLHAVGAFILTPELADALKQKHVALSSPSMLYSSAREYIKQITMNGPWGPLMLPGMEFRERKNSESDEKVSPEAAPKEEGTH